MNLYNLGLELDGIIKEFNQIEQIDLSNQVVLNVEQEKDQFIQAFVEIVPQSYRKKEFEIDIKRYVNDNFMTWLSVSQQPSNMLSEIDRCNHMSKMIKIELDLYESIKSFIEKHYSSSKDMDSLKPILSNLRSKTMQIQDHINQLKAKVRK